MNKLQLYQSASAAALDTLDEQDQAALQIAAATRFQTEKLDGRDFTEWQRQFAQCRAQFSQLRGQLTASAQADKQAAAREAAKQPRTISDADGKVAVVKVEA